jgi:hypothetical protein
MTKNPNGTFAADKTYLYEGRNQTVREIAEQRGMTPSTLHKRLKRRNDDIDVCLDGDFTGNQFIDLTGNTFGRLTVVSQAGKNKHSQITWNCICSCGTAVEVVGHQMRYGMTGSCGCLHKEIVSAASRTHGMSGTSIFAIHHSMMDRCYLPTSHAYSRYGGRGITVCDRWHDFENFFADMGHKPEGMSLERMDNNGEYSPTNVKWATTKEQANNRSSSRWIEFRGETKTLAQWADVTGVKLGTLWSRLKRGIPMNEAVVVSDRRYSNAC